MLLGQVEMEVPGAHDAVSPARVSTRSQRGRSSKPSSTAAYRMAFAGSTAKPFTPSLCPPAEFARGRTAPLAIGTSGAHSESKGGVATNRTICASARCAPCPSINGGPVCSVRLGSAVVERSCA
jgi:hypothetical protein